MLFHVSDKGDIVRFEPRSTSNAYSSLTESVVWAIDERHLPNYLLPRECPRVCYYARSDSNPQDVQRLLGPAEARHVVAIDSTWFERASQEAIWIYELPGEPFEVLDSGAGYHVSRPLGEPVMPRRIEKPLLEMLAYDVELRVLKDLASLQELVIKSTLQFSCIRMRNLETRQNAPSERLSNKS